MAKLSWKPHPFRLLLYLEWILLGISLLTLLSSLLTFPPPFLSRLPPPNNRVIDHSLSVITVTLLGLMGLRLPSSSWMGKVLYISAGFVLSWLTVIYGGRGDRVFPPLLLIVVIRACVLFPWSGRIFVALFSYACFIGLQVMTWLQIRPWDRPLGRPLPRLLRHLPPEDARNLFIGLTINSALLFALILAFVMLLVGAVLAEHESRQQLAIANRKLRQYALTVENQATLQERNRIAREIHDSVGHYLTAQSIQLENTALFFTENSSKAIYHLEQARKLGKEALQNVRQSVASLRNDPLKERSLSYLLETLIADFKKNTEIEINSKINLNIPLSSEIVLVLYRIIQEALTNIIKHSKADLISLKLELKNGTIHLEIKDNGQGFNPEENTTGFGLQSMKERTKALNGKFLLKSQIGQGCSIIVKIFNIYQ